MPLIAALVLAATASAASEPPQFEQLLLPLVTYRTPLPGANGSLWETVLTIRNEGDEPVVMLPPNCPAPVPQRFCWANTTIAPHTTIQPTLYLPAIGAATSAPVYLNVARSGAAKVFAQLRVHDLSRQAESFGTELPVVRRSDMKTGNGQILDVPSGSDFRVMLRLYADQPSQDSMMTVRIISETAGELSRSEYQVVAGVPITTPDPPMTPWFYREIAIGSASGAIEKLRIELVPEGPVRYWAFVTVTQNSTQHVTTLTIH